MSEKRREGSDGLAPFQSDGPPLSISHWVYVLEVISLIYGPSLKGRKVTINKPGEPTEQEEDSFLPDEIAYTVKK